MVCYRKAFIGCHHAHSAFELLLSTLHTDKVLVVEAVRKL